MTGSYRIGVSLCEGSRVTGRPIVPGNKLAGAEKRKKKERSR